MSIKVPEYVEVRGDDLDISGLTQGSRVDEDDESDSSDFDLEPPSIHSMDDKEHSRLAPMLPIRKRSICILTKHSQLIPDLVKFSDDGEGDKSQATSFHTSHKEMFSTMAGKSLEDMIPCMPQRRESGQVDAQSKSFKYQK